jgi:FtsP/CotA-like multicopper oxidase with cupredoxin domain
VRVPASMASMDGAIPEQQPVPPGEGTFECRFELLDAGTFWYHPHINEPR